MLQGSHFPNLPHNTSISRSHVSDLWLLPGMRHIMDHRMMGGRRKQAHRARRRQTDRRTSEHGAAGHAAAGLGLDDADFPVLLRGAEMDIMHACVRHDRHGDSRPFSCVNRFILPPNLDFVFWCGEEDYGFVTRKLSTLLLTSKCCWSAHPV